MIYFHAKERHFFELEEIICLFREKAINMWQGKGRFFVAVFAIGVLVTAGGAMRAQAPKAVTLQSVLRDATGRLVANRNVSVKITLRRGSADGSTIYQEFHSATTNQNGLYTVLFGQGQIMDGSITFDKIDWGDGPYFATVDVDPSGGSVYSLSISHPIVSVPYALYAENYEEKQVISIGHDTLYLTGGSFVKLPPSGGASDSLVNAVNHKLDSMIRVSCVASVNVISETKCDSFPWPLTQKTYTATGTHKQILERGNKKGCDSIILLNLTINKSSHNKEVVSAPAYYSWHGTSYTTSGKYTYSYTNDKGCASADTLYLTVNSIGALAGVFSVSATQKVRFSRGHLQYRGSDQRWRFADKQYTYIGNAAGNTTAAASRAGNSNWIDLFGWGTAGTPTDQYNTRYHPYDNATGTVNGTYNYYGYGPSTNEGGGNLTGDNYRSDWGYNYIYNGGYSRNLWRTLTSNEWYYLFYTRSGTRYCFATVAGVSGIVLFPDGYVHPRTTENTDYIAALGTKNSISGTYADNNFSADAWEWMEAAGAVFLPAAGYRDNITVTNSGAHGCYWSSTYYSAQHARHIYFYSGFLDYNRANSATGNRNRGLSVRLVQDVK